MKSPPVLLLLLALTLTFFRPSSALAETTCVHGTCLSHPSPPKCFAAPTVPFRRRSLPHRNALLTRDEEPSARGLSSDALQPITVGFHTRRGNGICYYLKPRTGGALWQRVGQGSETFYLPAGLYALKWIAAQDPTRLIFRIYRAIPSGMLAIVAQVNTYGGTFVSDGVHPLYTMIQHAQDEEVMKQGVEVWVQAIG